MNLPHDKFCVLPWVSLEASPIGTVRPCCLAIDEITDETGSKFKLKEHNLTTIQSSTYMQNLRQDFLNGLKPQTCRRCWTEERSGRTSKRMHTLERLRNMGISPEWTADAKPLMFLDLKLGNICNLKCRICGSWSSSQFATEEIKYNRQEETRGSFAYQMLKDGAWPRDSEEFWVDLDRHLDNVRYIEFTGGEPFMIEEHFELLRSLVSSGLAPDIEIHYNTNGTQFPERGLELWPHFKRVEIALSIDDIGPRFEYQRTGASWQEVQQNIEKFKELYGNLESITSNLKKNIDNVTNLAEKVDEMTSDYEFEVLQKLGQIAREIKENESTSTMPSNLLKTIQKYNALHFCILFCIKQKVYNVLQ